MNKKGFVLAEAIIVAVFVLGMFSYLAINILPLISKYDKALDYDNPSEIYLVNDLYEEILLRNIVVPEGDYKYSHGSGVVCRYNGQDKDSNICDDTLKKIIYNYLKVDEVLVLSSDDFDKNNLSRSMREYYNYYKNKNEIDQKVMLVKFQNGKFASIKMED